MLRLQKFIIENENWRELLIAAPYFVNITEDGDYLIFTYNQLYSDFHNPIVKECRGVILRKDNYKAVCVPFFKFGNYGEDYVDLIDWETATVEEKIDGSLIKFWYDDNTWHISTNGTINAYNAPLANDVKYNNFGELVEAAMPISMDEFDRIADRTFTYMFELVSPYNRVVVPYKETKLYFIGLRSNQTLFEQSIFVSEFSKMFTTPKIYPLHTLKDCIDSAQELPFDDEGYVVVDAQFNRNKIKSPAWIAVHHMSNNGVINKKRIVDLIKTGEDGEFLNYFPEYTNDFREIQDKMDEWINSHEPEYRQLKSTIAKIICAKDNPKLWWSTLNCAGSMKSFLYNQRSETILDFIFQ